MKKLFIIIIFLVANIASSQINFKNPTAVSFNGGLFLPYSSETLLTGLSLGVDVQHKIDQAYFFADLTYNFSSRKNNVLSQYYNNTSGSGLLVLSAGVRLYIAETKVKYFIDGGLGLYVENKGAYDIKINNITTSHPSESNTTLGGNIGFGGIYPINNNIDLVGKIKYHLYFGVGEDTFLNTYFGISAGIKYNIKL